MTYGYIRVSTDKQTIENQRFEINNFCNNKAMVVDGWIEDEAVSGTQHYKKRNLGKLLKKAKKGDIIVCSELSRLGRNLLMIMSILNYCMEREIKIYTIKDNYRLGDDIQSKVLAFAFGLSAEIERNLISQRTKEALARKKAEGVILGRPKGRKSSKTKLTGQEKKIYELLQKNVSYSAIGRILGVHRLTVSSFVRDKLDENGNLKKVEENLDIQEEIKRLLPFKEDMKKMYLQENKTMQEIAKILETSQLAISVVLKDDDFSRKRY